MEKTELQKMITDIFTEMDRLMRIEEAAKRMVDDCSITLFGQTKAAFDNLEKALENSQPRLLTTL